MPLPALLDGHRTWKMTRTARGHRNYHITHMVECEPTDGPSRALHLTPGLPLPGMLWAVDSDLDLWAWCRGDATVTPVLEGEPNRYFLIEQFFSTEPPDVDNEQCQDQGVGDPLLEPMKVSGSFIKYMEEATHDRFGSPIVNSAGEALRGPQVEFDANRHQIRIEQNVPVLGLNVFGPMVDTLNDAPLWGLPTRCIKLSNVSWDRKVHGLCYVYYTRVLEFDTFVKKDENGNPISGFDRTLLDEGTKALSGEWDTATGLWTLINIGGAAPNPNNYTHYVRVKDRTGEPMRIILDGLSVRKGYPHEPDVIGSVPGEIGPIQKYPESNFLLLGIPLSF